MCLLPGRWDKEFPHYFQRDFTKYFWSSDYTDDVLDPACDLYRGILSLYWPGCAGADGFAGFPDFEWISELYKPSVLIVFPLIVMGLLMLCFNMLADGLRDALDPKMKDM